MYMAPSHRRRAQGALIAFCALLGVIVAAGAAAAQTSLRQGTISLVAASTEFDYKNHKVILHDVVISQGDITIQADQAESTGLDFANSSWTFSGNVHINAEQRGKLQADRATVQFHDDKVAHASVSGMPAEFQQQAAAAGQLERGHADQIEYTVSDGTVRLSGDACLTDGRNVTSAPLLVYDIRQQHVRAAGEAGAHEQVHITINDSKQASCQ